MKLSYDRELAYYRIITEFSSLRMGIAGRTANNTDYSEDFYNFRKNEKQILKKITGLNGKNILFLNQVHRDDIILINSAHEIDVEVTGEADAFITRLKNICLVIRTADCVPVFFYDKIRNIIGAAHSGWRGTRLSIAVKLVKKMRIEFGSIYSDIDVFILPSIGPKSYEVNDDVASHFKNCTRIIDSRIYLDLWKSIENSLVEEGIPEENIYNAHECNLINRDKFFSHRNGDSGRNLNYGYINCNS